MNFRNYTFQLSIRLAVLFSAMLGLAFGIARDVQTSLLVILAFIIFALAISLIRYMHRTIRDMESFLSGFRYGDFQQSFTIRHLGSNFHRLENLLRQTVDKFRALRTKQEQQAVYFQTLVQHLPLPFLIIHSDNRVEILNMATRRAFNVAEISNTDQLARFGASLQRDVQQIKPGETLLSSVNIEDSEEYFLLSATSISLQGHQQKLIAMQNVQGELDATELATWQNLLRVTSHEILNSLAPVTSCAQTAGSLVDDILESELQDEKLRSDMEDIRDAIETMARRSEGLQRFVQRYRQLTRMPPPKNEKIMLGDYFQRLESLLKSELAKKQVELDFSQKPQSLTLFADENMLDQAMINLVRNAADAVIESGHGKIRIEAFVDGRQRVVIQVTDNGPGIDPEVARTIFVPFFTTKKQGSGVGLTLVRYIMLTHGGSVRYLPAEDGGSVFRLVF
jgi:two-component system nitrogen regulation sensor histidine kinase NtrY